MVTYKIAPNTQIEAVAVLPFMLRLMMSQDAMKSSLRWLELFKTSVSEDKRDEDEPPELQNDRLWNMITSAGWGGESLILLIRENKKHEGRAAPWVRREMLAGQDDLLKFWDDIFADQKSSALKRVLRIRDKYFAHWDQEIATAFVKENTAVAKDHPIMVTTDDSQFLKTTFPWTYMAIVGDLTGGSFKVSDFAIVAREIADLVGKVCRLVDHLLDALCEEHDIWFDRADS